MVKTVSQKVEELLSALRDKGIENVTKQYEMEVKYHKTYPWLAQLKYDQIKSDLNKVIPQVCRGIIVDTKDEFKVVALPYVKFFNYGEHKADKIDWATAKVYEKLDGSIITMYWYQDAWHVASSGLPDASGFAVGFGRLHGKERTRDAPVISSEFWRIWNAKDFKLPTDTTKCYMFELLLANYRNIVKSEDRIVLHGVRDLSTFAELDPAQTANDNGWECAKMISASSLEEVIEIAKILNPNDGEGFVVADATFNRVKIKSPQYVALALLSEGGKLNQLRMLEIVRANEGSEFLTYFPHVSSFFLTVKEKYDRMCADFDIKLATLRALPPGDTKLFYQEAQRLVPKSPWIFAACQKMSAQRVSDMFVTMELKKLNQLLTDFEAKTKRESEETEGGNSKSEKGNSNIENSDSDSDEGGKGKGKKKKGTRKKGER